MASEYERAKATALHPVLIPSGVMDPANECYRTPAGESVGDKR